MEDCRVLGPEMGPLGLTQETGFNKSTGTQESMLEVRVLELDAIFSHIRTMLTNQARNHVHVAHIDRNEAPRWLRGNPARLHQAVLNHALAIPRPRVNGTAKEAI